MYIDPGIERVLRDGLRREGWPKPARDVPSDKGGLTRGGITATNWGDYKHLGRPASRAELDAIAEDEALAFYFQRFVLLPHFDQVLDQKLRVLLIDWAFTSWSDDPVRAMQHSLATRGLYVGSLDGVIGPRTITALQSDRDPRQLFRDVFNARVEFYLGLALNERALRAFLEANPESQLHNVAGWIGRALELTP